MVVVGDVGERDVGEQRCGDVGRADRRRAHRRRADGVEPTGVEPTGAEPKWPATSSCNTVVSGEAFAQLPPFSWIRPSVPPVPHHASKWPGRASSVVLPTRSDAQWTGPEQRRRQVDLLEGQRLEVLERGLAVEAGLDVRFGLLQRDRRERLGQERGAQDLCPGHTVELDLREENRVQGGRADRGRADGEVEEARRAHGRRAHGRRATGVEPTGVEPTGVDPTGVEPTGVDPTGVDPTGVELVDPA